MNKKDWQVFYGFTDEDMDFIEYVLKLFHGKIVKVYA